MLHTTKHLNLRSKPSSCPAVTTPQVKGNHHRYSCSVRANSQYEGGNASNTLASLPPSLKVRQLLQQGANNYAPGKELGPAVEQLIRSNPTPRDNLASATFMLGQGTWEVFYAPHIARLSSVLATRFDPIRYTLDGEVLTSNVRFNIPVLGEGWLSAKGTMRRKYDDSVEVSFSEFWVDMGASKLRTDLSADSGPQLTADTVISFLGRMSFLPQLATFPVKYLDTDLAVFEFPTLSTMIAVQRVALPSHRSGGGGGAVGYQPPAPAPGASSNSPPRPTSNTPGSTTPMRPPPSSGYGNR